jgi:transposase
MDQLELGLEDLETDVAAKPASAGRQSAPPSQPARGPLPAELPRETETLSPKHSGCPDCGGALKHLGEDVSEMLEFVPGRFKVMRTVRPKLACNRCDAIVQEPAPQRPIDRALAGPGLLAHVLAGKYADHLPLYRQSAIYAREGIDLDRSTLASWVGGASRTLEPLVEAIRKYVMGTVKIHADDTPVPVLAPGNGKTKTGRLWTYVRDDRPAGSVEPPAVWFAYSRIVKETIPPITWRHSRAGCRRMLSPDSIGYMNEVASPRSHAGPTSGASSMTSTRLINHRSRKKHSIESRRCMESRRRFVDVHRTSGEKFGMHEPGRCWIRSMFG